MQSLTHIHRHMIHVHRLIYPNTYTQTHTRAQTCTQTHARTPITHTHTPHIQSYARPDSHIHTQIHIHTPKTYAHTWVRGRTYSGKYMYEETYLYTYIHLIAYTWTLSNTHKYTCTTRIRTYNTNTATQNPCTVLPIYLPIFLETGRWKMSVCVFCPVYLVCSSVHPLVYPICLPAYISKSLSLIRLLLQATDLDFLPRGFQLLNAL